MQGSFIIGISILVRMCNHDVTPNEFSGAGFGVGLKENTASPLKLDVPNHVVDFAASGEHLLVIDSQGYLYVAGDSEGLAPLIDKGGLYLTIF